MNFKEQITKIQAMPAAYLAQMLGIPLALAVWVQLTIENELETKEGIERLERFERMDKAKKG